MADTEKDAFELSEDDFEKVMSGESDEFILETGSDEEPPAGDEEPPASDEEPPAGDDELNLDLFSNEDDESPAGDEPPAGDEDMVNLIHNGQMVKVTRAEAVNLAQQGYDYQVKTARIAPQRKLLDLIDADEDLQGMINNYVAGKTTPAVTKREDYENEEDWLQDNMARATAAANPTLVTGTEEAPPTGQEAPIVTALRNRDPEHFAQVGPVLKQAISQLTVAQYGAITADPEKVVKFYDTVKQAVLTQQKPGGQTQTTPKKKTFNLRSGQGPNRSSKVPEKKNVWELGNKEFNSVLRKVKGY